jgi:hypothetical protein
LRRFAGLALAAREFPESGQVAAFGAARQQDAAAGVGDDAGDDLDDLLLSLRRQGEVGRGLRGVRWSHVNKA